MTPTQPFQPGQQGDNQNYQGQGCQQPGQGYQQGAYQQGYQQQGGYRQQQGYQQPYCRPYVEDTKNNAFNCGPEGKCRGVYAILAMVLGSLGLHYFYCNKIGGGILTIVLVCVTCGAWAVLPIIQGIVALWSMTNEEFDRKFITSTSFFPLF